MRLLAILLLALPMPLWAAIWQSNALMQPLALLEGEPDGGWWLVEEGSQRRLYYEGQLVATEDRSDGTLVRSGVDTEVTITFSGGRPVDEVREDGTRLSYTYRADGTLDSILTTHSDGTSSPYFCVFRSREEGARPSVFAASRRLGTCRKTFSITRFSN